MDKEELNLFKEKVRKVVGGGDISREGLHSTKGHWSHDGSTQELEFHPYMQSLAGSSCHPCVWGLNRWAWNAHGIQVCHQVSPGQFQFLLWSDSWCQASFSPPWSSFSCGRKLTNGLSGSYCPNVLTASR